MNMDNKQIAIKHAEHFIEEAKKDHELSANNHLILADFAFNNDREGYSTLVTGYPVLNYAGEWEN